MSTILPPFDFDLLRTFVAVVDNAGFTRAGERIGLTQSTVSLQIKKLESNLGRRVFARTGRALRLTPDGELLLPYARQLLQLGDEARSRLLEADVEGVVRLGTPEDFATVYLPDVLARFARTHPRVTLDVTCNFSFHLLEGFAKGEYDLALVKREPQGPAGGVSVWRDVLVWVGSPRLALTRHERVPLALAPAPTSIENVRWRAWRQPAASGASSIRARAARACRRPCRPGLPSRFCRATWCRRGCS